MQLHLEDASSLSTVKNGEAYAQSRSEEVGKPRIEVKVSGTVSQAAVRRTIRSRAHEQEVRLVLGILE